MLPADRTFSPGAQAFTRLPTWRRLALEYLAPTTKREWIERYDLNDERARYLTALMAIRSIVDGPIPLNDDHKANILTIINHVTNRR